MDYLPQIVFLGLVAVAGWYMLRPRPVFVLKVKGGVPRIVRGKVTDSFQKAVGDICCQCGVTSGLISGFSHGRRVRLKFSRSISADCQQQLRNMLLAG
jgi:hypothetical protein